MSIHAWGLRRITMFCTIVAGLCAGLQAQAVRPASFARPQAGPYVHTIQSASSADGINWTRDVGVRLNHASVPSAAALPDSTIRLYYVDADRGAGRPESTNCAVSADGITFKKAPITINGQTAARILDPCIVTSGSQWLLYHLAASMGPAQPSGSDINLAISDDGIQFANMGTVFRYPGVVDPDVFHYRDRWFMYVFSEKQTIIATSDNGTSFSYYGPLNLPGWGTTAPVPMPDGRLRLYAFEQHKSAGNKVGSFVSADGINWLQETGERLVAASNEQITDPFVVRRGNGYKMYFKVQPVSQPPSAVRTQPQRQTQPVAKAQTKPARTQTRNKSQNKSKQNTSKNQSNNQKQGKNQKNNR